MTHPVDAERTPLEHALLDVQKTLANLLAAADEQYAALAASDRERLERVTQRQERLAARLERAERRRMSLLQGRSLSEALASLPRPEAERVSELTDAIGRAVVTLRERQAMSAALLERSLELTGQTIQFLQRLVTERTPAYTARGLAASSQSLLVDGKA